MLRTALWLAVTALVATAGCSVDHRDPAATPSTPIQPTATSARLTSRAPGPVQVRPVGVLAVPHSDIGPLALTGHTAVFPLTEGGGPDWDSVGVFDADADTERVVAHTDYPQGLINWAAGSGDWVAWVDQSRRQSDFDPNVLWRVHALNTGTGQQMLLASNGNRPDPFVPQVHATGDWFYWTQAEPDRTAREQIWTPSWARPRALLRHTEMTPGSESVVDQQLVYLGPAATRHGAHTVGGDCWAVPLDRTGAPTRLTDTALAMGCAVSDTGALVWSEHIDPRTRPLPDDGVLDDPYQLRTQAFTNLGAATGDAKSRLLHRGYVSFGYPRAGHGFAAWQDVTGHVVLRSLDAAGQVRLPRGVDAITLTAAGDAIAYVTGRGAGTTLTVSTVTVR